MVCPITARSIERQAKVRSNTAKGLTTKRLLALPTLNTHAAIAPMLLVQSFYRMANALSIARGRDPDRPPFLNKVTETL